MKKLLLLVSFLGGLTLPAFGDEITIRADIYCPYNCEPQSEKPGLLIEIVKYAFEKAGHTVQYEILNWSRAVLETRKGKYNAIVGAYKGDAPDFVFPENGLAISQVCFYVKKENTWEFDGINSLSKVSIGVINDYSYGELLDKYIEEHKKDPERVQVNAGNDALEKNLSKLIKDRITVVVEDQAVMGYLLKKMGQSDAVRKAGCLEAQNIYVAFSPENPKSHEYANILSKGIQELKESGRLKTILEAYGITDWK